VAAPTAGLHFEPELLEKLVARGIETAFVTLHVGPGTFRPPTIAQVVARRLHREYFHYPAATDAALRATRERGGRVIAVGTTTLRVLETVHRLRDTALADRASVQVVLPQDTDHGIARESGKSAMFAGEVNRKELGWEVCGTTRLFIRPPDKVVAADALLTNFHLPESSLLMLVAALAPDPLWRRAYRYAVDQRFRFYSYGDAMLILPQGRERSYES
jgi:S-adenosylmethionine:tRNA ribosyltransferase-isomerase